MAQQTRQSLMALPMRVYGSFGGKAAGVPSVPGLEFTLEAGPMHETLGAGPAHATLEGDRMHFVCREDD